MIRFSAAALLATSVAGASPHPAERTLSIRLAPQAVDGEVDAIAEMETFDLAAEADRYKGPAGKPKYG